MAVPRPRPRHRRRAAAGGTASSPATRSQISRVLLKAGASFGPTTINVVALALLLGLLAVVTARALGPADRGIIVLFMTMGSVMTIIASLGVNTYARVHLVAQSNALQLPQYLRAVGLLTALQAALVTTVGGVVLWATGSLVSPWILPALALYGVLNFVTYMLRDGLYAFGYNTKASRADAVAALAQVAFITLAWTKFGLNVSSAVGLIAAGQGAAVIYVMVMYRRLNLFGRPRGATVSITWLVRRGIPAVVTDLGRQMLYRLDRILLGFFASTAVVGVYSVAATMSEVLFMVPNAIGLVAFHRVASGAVSYGGLRRIRQANLLLAIVIAAILWVAGPSLTRLLFGAEFLGAVTPLRILLIAGIAMASYLVDIACVNAMGHLGAASRLTAWGFAVVAALDLGLIPWLGARGAAAASLIAYGVVALGASRRLVRGQSLRASVAVDHPNSGTGT